MSDRKDVILDAGKQQLFLFLVPAKAEVQRCTSTFLYKTIVHALFSASVMGDEKRASTIMMGMGCLQYNESLRAKYGWARMQRRAVRELGTETTARRSFVNLTRSGF